MKLRWMRGGLWWRRLEAEIIYFKPGGLNDDEEKKKGCFHISIRSSFSFSTVDLVH